MHLESYELIYDMSSIGFSFISEGKRGSIRKIVQFQKLNHSDFYNLAFGDEDDLTKEINDLVVTNNGDAEKVLATVANAVYLFTNKNPEALIYIEGSTEVRTRLYQIAVNKFLDLLKDDFYIYGEFESDWLIYEKEARYSALLVRRKNLNFER